MLTVSVGNNKPLWSWKAVDFTASPPGRTPATPERRTSSSGMLEVSFRLTNQGTTISAGSVQLPLSRDWRWTVELRAVTTDPAYGCFGCVGTRAFPLREAYRVPGRDSIWVVWGGNSISRPVAY